MFKTIIINLPSPVTEANITIFTDSVLKNTNAIRTYLDPLEKKKFTVQIPIGSDEKITHDKILAEFQKVKEGGNASANLQKDIYKYHTKRGIPCNCTNVADGLLDKEWMVLLQRNGIGYSSEIITLLEFFDYSYVKFMKSEIASRGYKTVQERSYSPLISKKYFEKMNYFKNSPKQLFFANHLNYEKLDKFSEIIEREEGCFTEDANCCLGETEYVLQSASCFNVYFELEGKETSDNTIFTVLGSCFRNEVKTTYFMERLLNFRMREFVFVGSKEFVTAFKEQSLDWTIRWMDTLGIKGECHIAHDPFFISDKEHDDFDIPDIIKYEIRADIPYKSDSLAIASFDVHGDFFAKSFNISHGRPEKTWTGCIGLGIERIVWSFLQQHGLNFESWPAIFVEKYSKFKEGFRS